MKKHIEKDIDKVVQWLRKMVNESGTKGLIVGVSGGIDSAVVAYLIKKACPNNSIGVILPCKSNPKDKEDALAVVNGCGIDSVEVDLTQIHESLFDQITNNLMDKNLIDDKTPARLSDANLRARLRMSTIYAIANTKNYLVAGTDNAAEVYTGYFTKYGDGGVDILPIANLLKRDVYEWARVLGVPKSVLDRAPSAGLWEGQTDEKEMGTTYDMIDDLIEGKEIPQKDREVIENLHRKTEHKRKMPPAPEK
ncbi:NAD(+) synthase [Anaeromicrobium sediminis]|uniref:NH(3)-dependent NAD(+) synthetase n=1 Tax=Anaeromicrobium sediminis TaxID=1478221 RepID=A0A267MJM4_9FIRM|nr:NAD(+) synthase [Anaeromicrobium sediminis]PAB58983.1 NAD(+) synthase [Anaeromicrobium sediminis]